MIELNDDSIITLTDENGTDVDFLMLDVVEYQGGDYLVLLPLGDEDDEELEDLVILKAETTDEGEQYEGVEDQAILDAVFAIFQQQLEEAEAEDDAAGTEE